MNGAGERGSGEMALGGLGDVVVPDIFEGVVEADAFETVIEADGPALLARKSREGELGEVLEASDCCVVFGQRKQVQPGCWGSRGHEVEMLPVADPELESGDCCGSKRDA